MQHCTLKNSSKSVRGSRFRLVLLHGRNLFVVQKLFQFPPQLGWSRTAIVENFEDFLVVQKGQQQVFNRYKFMLPAFGMLDGCLEGLLQAF